MPPPPLPNDDTTRDQPLPAGVIFDLDGVLLDSAEFHRRSWYRLAAEAGFEMNDARFWESFGKTNATILRGWLGVHVPPADLERLGERKEELFRDEGHGHLALFPGVREALAALRDAGLHLALGTSTPRSNVLFFYRELGLGAYMQAYTCSNDVRRGKPDPEVFVAAAAKIGLPPARCVVVEDAFIGIEAALAAGMKCVAVASTNPAAALRARSQAHLILDSAAELTPQIVRGLLGG